MPPTPSSYTFKRYTTRAIFNVLGAVSIKFFYLFIVFVYLCRTATNEIIPGYPINARGVLYAWLILSIFVLDWATSAIAGFEASSLTKPRLAPSNAMQLMWHADRTWGSLSGWWKASVLAFVYLRHRLLRKKEPHAWKEPSALWWYLTFSSFLLYVAIPQAGLSMEPRDTLRLKYSSHHSR